MAEDDIHTFDYWKNKPEDFTDFEGLLVARKYQSYEYEDNYFVEEKHGFIDPLLQWPASVFPSNVDPTKLKIDRYIRHCYFTSMFAGYRYKENFFYCISNEWESGYSRIKYCNQLYEKCDGYWEDECNHITLPIKIPSKDFVIDNAEYAIYNFRTFADLIGKRKLIIQNIRSFNDDHRGSDHTIHDLAFIQSFKIDLSKYYDPAMFIKQLYALKSHKYDKHYEMYCHIENIEFNRDTVLIQLQFDHGS